MKSFQAVIISAIVAASPASNEHIESHIVAIEQELAKYERQLETSAIGVSLTTVPVKIGHYTTLQKCNLR